MTWWRIQKHPYDADIANFFIKCPEIDFPMQQLKTWKFCSPYGRGSIYSLLAHLSSAQDELL